VLVCIRNERIWVVSNALSPSRARFPLLPPPPPPSLALLLISPLACHTTSLYMQARVLLKFIAACVCTHARIEVSEYIYMRTTVYIVRISYVRTPGSCVLSKVESRPVRSGSNLGQLNRRKCTHMSSRIINRHAAPPAYNLIRAVGRNTTSRRRESSRKFSPWLRRAVSTERSEIKQTWRVCATSERGKRKRERERERERETDGCKRAPSYTILARTRIYIYIYIYYIPMTPRIIER